MKYKLKYGIRYRIGYRMQSAFILHTQTGGNAAENLLSFPAAEYKGRLLQIGKEMVGGMLQDPLTLYKLIVLYMLDRVNFPMTNAQVSDYILEKEYTNYLTLQQVINELSEARMISLETIRNRTHLSITAEGRETLRFFQNLINYGIKQDIDEYFRENEYILRNEVSVLGDYYYSARAGGYEAHLTAKDKDINLVDIRISVPTEEIAEAICKNWQAKNQDIYQYLVKQLF